MDTIPEELLILIIKSARELCFTLSLLNHKFNRICMDQPLWSNLLKETFNIDSGDDNYIGKYWRLSHFVECNNLNDLMFKVEIPDQITILLHKGANIEARNKRGWTALHHAAHYGHDKVVCKLIAKGADIEAKDDLGWTPLYYAAVNGHDKVISNLMEKGADIEVQDSNGITPLFIAGFCGHNKVVNQLIGQRSRY